MKVVTDKYVRDAGALACALALAMCCAPALSAAPAGIEYLKSPQAAMAALPFSEAVRVGGTLYLSGQIGTAPGTLALVPGGMPAEARQALDNIKAILERHGYSLGNVVKCTVMLADMSEWAAFNDVYRGYFKDRLPARSALGANGLAMGARVEVECIAAK